MTGPETRRGGCPDANEILEDLAGDDVLELKPGEKLWKLYCFRSAGHATGLRHRVYSKRKADGRLALVTFAVHNPPRSEDGSLDTPRPVRSNVARVPDLSAADLEKLIGAVRAQARHNGSEEIDLSQHTKLEDQWAWLEQQDF